MPTLARSASASATASARGRFCTCTGASTTFSSTVMWDQRLKLWNTIATFMRMRATWPPPAARGVAVPRAAARRSHAAAAILLECDRLAADRDLAGVRHLEHVDAAK